MPNSLPIITTFSQLKTNFGGNNTTILLSDYYLNSSSNFTVNVPILNIPSKGSTIYISSFNTTSNVYPPLIKPTSITYTNDSNITVVYGSDTYNITTSFTYTYWGGNITYLDDLSTTSSWGSLYNVYFPGYTGGNYIVSNVKGEWIKYKLPRQISINKYTISCTGGSGPSTWVFYGSNNGETWTEITQASQSTAINNTNYDNNYTYTKILSRNSPLYLYFGITITSLISPAGDYAAYVSDLRLFAV